MKGVFWNRHPILLTCYFGMILLLTILTLHPISLILSFLAGIGYRLLSGGYQQLKILLWMTPLFVFIILINPLFVHQGETVLYSFFGRPITLQAIVYGICNALLLATATLWIACCMQVITPERLRYLLGKHFPSLALLFGMLFRFLPLFQRKAEEMKMAQYGIGHMQPHGGCFRRGKEKARLLTTLVPWSLEQSAHTATVLSARGYRTFGRTNYRSYSFTKTDALFLTIILICGGIGVLGLIAGGRVEFYPTFSFGWNGPFEIALIAQGVLLLLPFAEWVWEEIRWKRYR